MQQYNGPQRGHQEGSEVTIEMAEITHGVSMFCRPLENLILGKGGQIV